jgi:ferric-dicitrate binding protein FerR (iron transport regulator)
MSGRDLIDAYLNEDLSPEQQEQLFAWLETDVQNMKVFIRAAHIHGALRNLSAVAAHGNSARARIVILPPAVKRRILLRAGAIAAAVAITLVAVLVWSKRPSLTATIETATAATIVRDGHSVPAMAGEMLHSGDRVLTATGGGLKVRYEKEPTELTLFSDTTVEFRGPSPGKLFFLESGKLYAQVAPQPIDAPLRVLTPHAEAVVLGTAFTLVSGKSDSRLDVEKGKVRLQCGGQSIEVLKGEAAQASSTTSGIALQSIYRADELWDKVLTKITLNGDIVVPAGQRWLVGSDVRIAGTLRTDAGVIAMRPGSSLEFVGATAEQFIGGGENYDPRFAQDYGLWIGGEGVLDIRGTPKAGWNRTGQDSTWLGTDEYYITPIEHNEFAVRKWARGTDVPQADPRVPAAEVINVTRDIVITGPGHIHISSRQPQRIEYVELRNLGISKNFGPLPSRSVLQICNGGNGTRGTIIRGVAAVDARGRVFVIQGSHGVTLEDCVSVNSYAEGFWSAPAIATNELTITRLCISGVAMPRTIAPKIQLPAVALAGGIKLSMHDSVVSGAQGGRMSHGFEWLSSADNYDWPSVWDFKDNAAHNNHGAGVHLSFSGRAPHHLNGLILYRNSFAGIESGSYSNAIRYSDCILIDNPILQTAASTTQIDDNGPARYERIRVINSFGPAIEIGRLRNSSNIPTEWIHCTLQSALGTPKIRLGSVRTDEPINCLFVNCGITPEDIEVTTPYQKSLSGTKIVIAGSRQRLEVTLDVENSRKVVRSLPIGDGSK